MAIILIINSVKEFISFDIKGTTSVVKSNNIMDVLFWSIVPILTALSFWNSIINFDFKNIKISLSTILAIIISLYLFDHLHYISTVFRILVVLFLSLLSFIVFYKWIFNKIPLHFWNKIQIFGKTHMIVFIYAVSLIFAILVAPINIEEYAIFKLLMFILYFILGLVLLYIRNLFGLRYAIILHYLFVIPSIVIPLLAQTGSLRVA